MSRWASTRQRALSDLEIAQKTLANLEFRLSRAKAVDPEQMLRMSADPKLRPSWLDQPARMFNKNDDASLAVRLLPGIDGEVVNEFNRLAGNMPNTAAKIELANTLRRLHGTVPHDVFTKVLRNLGKKTKLDEGFEHLANTDGASIVHMLRAEFHRTSLQGLNENNTANITLAQATARKLRRYSTSEDQTLLITNVMGALGAIDAPGSELGKTKNALLLRLANIPAQASNKIQTLELSLIHI